MLNNLLQMHLKLLQKSNSKKKKKRRRRKTEATADLIGNKIADKITKIAKHLQQNNLETITNEHDKEISKEGYISPEEREKIIDDLRLI